MSRRVLVCGGRDFADVDRLYRELDARHAASPFTCVIHGGARGADRIASAWARERGVPIDLYLADWRNYGPSAGPRRNARMLVEGKPDTVIAFPGGRGTADMIAKAHAAGVPVVAIPVVEAFR